MKNAPETLIAGPILSPPALAGPSRLLFVSLFAGSGSALRSAALIAPLEIALSNWHPKRRPLSPSYRGKMTVFG
jgi:hypothetical protein